MPSLDVEQDLCQPRMTTGSQKEDINQSYEHLRLATFTNWVRSGSANYQVPFMNFFTNLH